MNRSYILVIVLVIMVGGIAATYAATVIEGQTADLTCAGERTVVFGWTHKQVAMAELAAIAKWQGRVEKKRPGFGNWHLADKRNLSCRLFPESSHYQCQISATPCRYDHS